MRVIFCGFVFLTSLFSLDAQAEFKRFHVHHSSASSYLQNNWNRFSENYHPNYAFDDNAKTAWVEGAKGNGLGETLSFQVSKNSKATRVKFKIRNGYQKSKTLFKANAAPQKVVLEVYGPDGNLSAKSEQMLKNKMGFSEIILPLSRGISSINLIIKSARKGSLYKDTCISDIQVFVETDKSTYKASVEKAKQNALRSWAKERLSAARNFAKKKSVSNFVAPEFRHTDPAKSFEEGEIRYDQKTNTESKNKNFIALKTRIETRTMPEGFELLPNLYEEVQTALATFNDKSHPRYRVESGKLKKVFIPDALEWHLRGIEHFFGPRLPDFAESTQKIQKKNRFDPPNKHMMTHEDITTAQVQRREADQSLKSLFFQRSVIVAERSVYKVTRSYLLKFDNQERLSSVIIFTEGDEFSLRVFDIQRNEEALIARVNHEFALSYEENGWYSSFAKDAFVLAASKK